MLIRLVLVHCLAQVLIRVRWWELWMLTMVMLCSSVFGMPSVMVCLFRDWLKLICLLSSTIVGVLEMIFVVVSCWIRLVM